MNYEELSKHFSADAIKSEPVNPLSIAEHEAFETTPREQDYREVAMQKVLRLRLSFASTCNSAFNVLKNYIQIKCPCCGAVLPPGFGSGNCSVFTTEYKCTHCNLSVNLTIPDNGFSVRFDK